MNDSQLKEPDLKEALAGFLERNRGCLTIEKGWAPNPPPEHAASKLTKVTVHSKAEFASHLIFWLWCEDCEEKWKLVDAWHWAVRAARETRWALTEFTPHGSDLFLQYLPIEVLVNV